jgi:alanine-glyoxylate transaminase/serine-glyoxylate transaminase/serine-pyruvate transaminase
MDDVCQMLREVFHTSNHMTFPVSSTGTGAMETACANIIERGDTVVVCCNGFFGDRFADIAQRCGAVTHSVDTPWGQPVDVDALAEELDKHPKVKAVGIVHGETSTGVLNPLQEVIDLAHSRGAVVIVDAVTTLGGHEVRMDDWEIDVCYSATQKCLGAPPGLAPISLGPRAMDIVTNRASKVESFYFSLQDLENYWSQRRAYHHTAPISMTYALREALQMMMEEGLENRLERHARVAAALRAGLEALGIDLFSDPDYRLNPLTTALVPEGIDDAAVRGKLLNGYDIEIGGGLGELRGKVWRIGLMGESAREINVFGLLSALEMVLSGEGYEVAYGASLSAAQKALSAFAA